MNRDLIEKALFFVALLYFNSSVLGFEDSSSIFKGPNWEEIKIEVVPIGRDCSRELDEDRIKALAEGEARRARLKIVNLDYSGIVSLAFACAEDATYIRIEYIPVVAWKKYNEILKVGLHGVLYAGRRELSDEELRAPMASAFDYYLKRNLE